MNDIVPELQEQILSTFNKRESIDIVSKSFWKKVEKETAAPEDASAYARRLGEIASDVLEKSITEDVLPDGNMYWNIAERIIVPLLKEVHNRVNEAAEAAQKIQDRKTGIGLNSVVSEWPEKRVYALVQKIADISGEANE